MMTLKARLISFAVGLAILFVVSWFVRRRRIYNIYAATWLGISAMFLGMGTFAGFADATAEALGVGFTPVAILVLLLGSMLLIMLHLSVIVSDQHNELKRVEKELSLLRVLSPSKD